ncbi:unnamed protein product [Amoebophrya sp. A120]|nr:unnamed protein product [Amoebophrya sp. A120]|eukprot:GSA120T00021459001.1
MKKFSNPVHGYAEFLLDLAKYQKKSRHLVRSTVFALHDEHPDKGSGSSSFTSTPGTKDDDDASSISGISIEDDVATTTCGDWIAKALVRTFGPESRLVQWNYDPAYVKTLMDNYFGGCVTATNKPQQNYEIGTITPTPDCPRLLPPQHYLRYFHLVNSHGGEGDVEGAAAAASPTTDSMTRKTVENSDKRPEEVVLSQTFPGGLALADSHSFTRDFTALCGVGRTRWDLMTAPNNTKRGSAAESNALGALNDNYSDKRADFLKDDLEKQFPDAANFFKTNSSIAFRPWHRADQFRGSFTFYEDEAGPLHGVFDFRHCGDKLCTKQILGWEQLSVIQNATQTKDENRNIVAVIFTQEQLKNAIREATKSYSEKDDPVNLITESCRFEETESHPARTTNTAADDSLPLPFRRARSFENLLQNNNDTKLPASASPDPARTMPSVPQPPRKQVRPSGTTKNDNAWFAYEFWNYLEGGTTLFYGREKFDNCFGPEQGLRYLQETADFLSAQQRKVVCASAEQKRGIQQLFQQSWEKFFPKKCKSDKEHARYNQTKVAMESILKFI